MKLFFHKTIKFNENDSKSTSYFSSCIKKIKKWDRTLASIFGLLAFFTLMGIGIYSIFRHKTCTDCKPNHEASCDNKDAETPSKAPVSKFAIYDYCSIISETCYMICQYININESIGKHINAALQGIESPCSDISLEIKNTTFPEAQLSNGWLKYIKTNITTLTIYYESNLKEINAQAFQGHPFKANLNVLRIANTYITTLRKNAFLGLSSLNKFIFEGSYRGRLNIEEEALTGMDNLTYLRISKVILTSKDMTNLIGDKGVPQQQLQELDLNHNIIPELLENSFTNIKESVRVIYLIGSGIETIHKKTFSGMKNLEILRLVNNNLETLEDGTFDTLSNLRPEGLMLGHNKWICTCSLQWLKDYLSYTNFIYKSVPPLCKNYIKFEDIEFCPTGGPDCTEIRKKLGIKILECKNERSYSKYKSASNDEFHIEEIIVEDQKVTLQLQELEGDPLEVKVMISEPTEILKSYYLVWTSSENKTKYGCKTHLEDGQFLQLERDTSYAFSVLYQCESETSPECTFGMKTLPEWPLRTWISNEYQAVVIGITVLVAICAMGIATFATFLCIRRYPKLISGNKSVIIVKPTKTEESTFSREYEGPQYWEPSIAPSTQGYLTPKNHRYASYLTPLHHIYDRIKYRLPLTRDISQLTVSSNTSIYGQPPPHVGMEKSEKIEVHAYQDFRPPLPPPNPGTRCGSSNEGPEEMIYSVS